MATPLNMGIVASFILLVITLLALSLLGVGVLRGMRGFVLHDALWSKAEKQAAAALQAYMWTGYGPFHEAFLEQVQTPIQLGRVREALNTPVPDRHTASEALVASGVPPELVGPMVSTFHRFREMEFVERAAESWREMDEGIARLVVLGEEARNAWEEGTPKEPYLVDLSERVGRLDADLTELSDTFSLTFTQGALQLERWLIGFLLTVGLLVLIAGAGGGAFIFREMATREAALEASERRYRLLFERSTMPVFVTTLEGEVLRVNRAGARLIGLEEPDDLVGRPMAEFLPTSGSWEEEVRELREVGTIRGVEESWRSADNRDIWVLRSGTLVEDPDSGGEVILRTAQDITDRRALEERLARTERLEAMGRLAGGVAHDFNNLLTAIMGYTQLLLHEVESSGAPDGEALEAIREIMKASDTAAALTRQLLTFSRSHVETDDAIEVGEVLRGILPILHRMVSGEIELVVELESTEQWVRMDPARLEQVVLNLVINARDAIDEGTEAGVGEIRLVADTLILSAAEAPEGVRPGRYLRLQIRDTGPGIPAKVREKIFEPFFSTREEGTGMGLATVFGVVQGAGGTVTVECPAGGGTIFEVLLPASEPADGGRGSERTTTVASSRARTVLIVDDNESVRTFAESVLRRAGHCVHTAASGPEGIEVARTLGQELELIISDVVMPGMSGPEMIQKILTGPTTVPVLYVSGYTDHALAQEEVEERGRFLQKPFTPELLLLAVKEASEGGR